MDDIKRLLLIIAKGVPSNKLGDVLFLANLEKKLDCNKEYEK